MIDSHAHIDFPDFDGDRDEVLERAREAGITHVVNVAIDLATAQHTVELARAQDCLSAAVAFHPNSTARVTDEEWRQLEALARDLVVVGIGETGLDYYRDGAPREVQREFFQRTLELAAQVGKPVIVHNRNATEDVASILSGYQGRLDAVLHCFGGTADEARRFLDMGFFISFAGPVTFPKADNLRDVVKTVPLDRLLVETDCPYLAPQPVRGKRNEPAYVRFTLERIATILGKPAADVDEITTANARSFFRLPTCP